MTRVIAVLVLLLAIALVLRGVDFGLSNGGDTADVAVISPRSSLAVDEDGGDGDGDDDENDTPPNGDGGDTPDTATLATRSVVARDDDGLEGDGEDVTPTPTPTDNDGTDSDGIDTPTPTDNDGTDSDGIDTPPPTVDSAESDDSDDVSSQGSAGEVAILAQNSPRTVTRARRSKRASSPAFALYPDVDFPDDPALPDLPRLFDPEWVRQAWRDLFEDQLVDPDRVRVRQFSHFPGRNASICYEAKWREQDYLPDAIFTVNLRPGKPAESFKYPEDGRLPGLALAADPGTAIRLVDKYVFTIPRRVMAVETVRYRPGNRAILRHRAKKAHFYARIVRPEAVPDLLDAARLLEQSKFVSPPVVGCWADGGVVWVPEVSGENMRDALRNGHAPEPEAMLEGLETLWDQPFSSTQRRPFDLAGAFRRAERTFRHALGRDQAALELLADTTSELRPFVDSWQPTAIAHNDFYDDQMVMMADGRVALVDIDDAGPGDPQLDVGNFLAHLRWASAFDNNQQADTRGAYHDRFKQAALDRFGWSPDELVLREAVCVFRVCTNTIRRLKPNWHENTLKGLDLVSDTLL